MNDPIVLAPLVDHTTAPIWYTAAHGCGASGSTPLLCPACGSGGTRIRTGVEEIYVVSRADATYTLGVADGPLMIDDPEAGTLTGITVPMICPHGHEWMLCIEQESDGQAQVSVMLAGAVYEALHADAKEMWG